MLKRSPFKLAQIQMCTTSNKANNLKTAESLIRSAAAQGAQVIMLPEIFVCPY